jgi:hypothetical protein
MDNIAIDKERIVETLEWMLNTLKHQYDQETNHTPNMGPNQSRPVFAMNRLGQRNLTKVAETHRANLQKRLLHRLDVAKANGDENLIRILESEMKQL